MREGISEYSDRIGHYVSYTSLETDFNYPKGKPSEVLKKFEADKILESIRPRDYLVLLDENGKNFSSEEFAVWMNKKLTAGHDLVFICGSAYGFDASLKKRADELIALSRFTFTHQMARLIFTEQLYRAFTILKNEPYHHS